MWKADLIVKVFIYLTIRGSKYSTLSQSTLCQSSCSEEVPALRKCLLWRNRLFEN